jgi:tetratricopeptide (TPR) repeat protein
MRHLFPIWLRIQQWLTIGRHAQRVVLGLVALAGVWITALPVQAYDLRDNAVTHADAGRQLLYLERPAEAIEEFKAALVLNPYAGMAAQIYNNLGLAYRATGNYIYAYAAFERACRIQPTFSLAFKNLVDTYVQAGRLPQAQLYFRERLLENPDNAEAWFILGYIYKANKNPKAAKACFERFLKLEPDSEMARAARTAL